MINASIELNKRYIASEFPDLFKKYQRLKGVGGFISILGSDPRASIFCRYNHVQRVVTLTNYMVNELKIKQSRKIMFLAYFHDINRLPLSYITEKAMGYNQSSHIRSYLRMCKDEIPEEYINALEAIMDKKIKHSAEVRLVYLSDVVVNYVEDLLFAIILLGISPMGLPDNILSAIGFVNNESEYIMDVELLKKLYAAGSDSFTKYFQSISMKYFLGYIDTLGGINIFSSRAPVEKHIAILTIKHFLQESIFPEIDEGIVKGESLVGKVVMPYFCHMKERQLNPYRSLWRLTDRQFIDSAVFEGLVEAENIQELYPSLDVGNVIYTQA